jgi:hypothetical protein
MSKKPENYNLNDPHAKPEGEPVDRLSDAATRHAEQRTGGRHDQQGHTPQVPKASAATAAKADAGRGLEPLPRPSGMPET